MSSSIITYDSLHSAMSLCELRERKKESKGQRDGGNNAKQDAGVLVKGKAKVSKTFKKVKTILGAKKKTKAHLTKCMEEDPKDRPTVQDLSKCLKGLIKQHEFLVRE